MDSTALEELIARNKNFLVHKIKSSEQANFNYVPQSQANKPNRLITIIGTGEQTLPPDRVQLRIVTRSVKSNVEEAKSSVERRYHYIYQTLRKYKINESNISSCNTYNKQNDSVELVNEITATMSDFQKFQEVYNVLNEKLDKTVIVSLPVFYSTTSRIESIKKQASIQALKNAKQKAFNLAKSVRMNLGKPITIEEKEFQQASGTDLSYQKEHLNDLNQRTISELINEATITVKATISVTFELRNALNDNNN